jgi:hypothetical protein
MLRFRYWDDRCCDLIGMERLVSVCSQVIDVLEAQEIEENGNKKVITAVAPENSTA